MELIKDIEIALHEIRDMQNHIDRLKKETDERTNIIQNLIGQQLSFWGIVLFFSPNKGGLTHCLVCGKNIMAVETKRNARFYIFHVFYGLQPL